MNIGCDNEDINEAQLLGFLQTQLSEEQLSAALWIFRVYFQSGIASFAKVKIQEVGRGSDEHKSKGESLNYDWIPLKFVLNLTPRHNFQFTENIGKRKIDDNHEDRKVKI